MIAFPGCIGADTRIAPVPEESISAAATIAFRAPELPNTPEDNERLGDEIARLAAHLHAATYHLLVLIREFDEREGWGWGFLSCAQWLSWRTGIGPGPAREKVRVARALGSLPLISGAMAKGELSYSKVRALTRVASPDNQAELLEVARAGTAAHIEKLVRTWRLVDRHQEADAEQQRHDRRFLRMYPDHDGSYVLRGRLDPEVGALVAKALEWASDELFRADEKYSEVSAEQRRADALALVAERAMAAAEFEERQRSEEEEKAGEEAEEKAGEEAEEKAGEKECADAHQTPGHRKNAAPLGRADRFQVVVHVDAPLLEQGSEEGLAHLADSALGVPAETSRRLACDASVVQMTHGPEGQILDVGRKRRTVPPAIRRALDHRDSGCRFPGCGCRFTDAHHITHWADGGETKLDNLVLLCRRHHRAVHEGGFQVEPVEGVANSVAGGAARGDIRFIRPDGREIPTAPEVPTLTKRPVAELMRAHQVQGIEPDAWTATPSWNGERFDYDMAISSLWAPRTQSE